MESSTSEISPTICTSIQPPEHISQLPFCQALEDKSLLVMHTENPGDFIANIEIDTILNISEDVELNPVPHSLQSNRVGYEIINLVCHEKQVKSILRYINARKVVNLTSKKCKAVAKTDHNQSTDIDNLERLHTTANGLGRNTCSINVEQMLEYDTMSECPINKESKRDDISLQLDTNVIVQRAVSEANISCTCGEAILNTEYSAAEEKKGVLGNVGADVAIKRTPDLPKKDNEANFGNLEYSSIHGKSFGPLRSFNLKWHYVNCSYNCNHLKCCTEATAYQC